MTWQSFLYFANPMELQLRFANLRFPESVIRKAVSTIDHLPSAKEPGRYITLTTTAGPETWIFDEVEEFFASLTEADGATLSYEIPLQSANWRCHIRYFLFSGGSEVHISSEHRSEIQAVMNIFRGSQEQATLISEENEQNESIEEKEFNIFLGHGRSPDWQQLRDHLRDKHQYNIVTFETGVRAGHHIRDILDEMLEQSSLAFLVLTGEDETADQRLRARQNVIHETGLFQGKLGFSKAIVILEEGVEGFSNNAGIQHISFAKGHIEGVFGDVVATIKREMKRRSLEDG
jgi:predicted nucleotide-binding protein